MLGVGCRVRFSYRMPRQVTCRNPRSKTGFNYVGGLGQTPHAESQRLCQGKSQVSIVGGAG